MLLLNTNGLHIISIWLSEREETPKSRLAEVSAKRWVTGPFSGSKKQGEINYEFLIFHLLASIFTTQFRKFIFHFILYSESQSNFWSWVRISLSKHFVNHTYWHVFVFVFAFRSCLPMFSRRKGICRSRFYFGFHFQFLKRTTTASWEKKSIKIRKCQYSMLLKLNFLHMLKMLKF